MVVPTLNRDKDLTTLLSSLLIQTQPANEIIVIDDSSGGLTAKLVRERTSPFADAGTKIIYLRGIGQGNTSARNIGIRASTGDAVLFLDDDTVLERNVIEGIAKFLRENPAAMGVQPRIPGFADYWADSRFGTKLETCIDRVALITYHAPNRLSVRRSGAAIFPSILTEVIPVQRMMGCSFCLRRSLLSEFSFDTNLRRWGCYDDLDLTYRVYRRFPGSLFAIPTVNVVHNHSKQSRLPSRPLNKMSTIYWFYIFFKDLSDESILNSLAFMWAMGGFFLWSLMRTLMQRDGKLLIVTRYLIEDYADSLWHLRSIRKGELDFFNRTLN